MESDARQMRVSFGLLDACRLGFYYAVRRPQRTAINLASIALATSLLSAQLLNHASTQRAAALLISVATLVITCVGVCNTMLISVYERFREIGTLKCLGALDGHVLKLFLVEAGSQGFTGGLLGFALGLAIAGAQARLGSLQQSPGSVIVPLAKVLALSVSLAILSSLYPAWRASKLTPVEALSSEQ